MQFDVHKDRAGSRYPLLLDVQADLLAQLDTRVVVPLAPKRTFKATPLRIVNPVLKIDGTEYVAVFQELAAIAKADLGAVKASAVPYRSELIAALDFLFTGT